MELLANYRIFQTEDHDFAQDFGSKVWENHHSELKRKNYRVTWNQAPIGQSNIAFVDHPCGIDAHCEGPLTDTFRVMFQHSGHIDHMISGRRVSSDGQFVVHAPTQEIHLDIAQFSMLMLNLDGNLVRSAMARRLGQTPSLETWVPALPAVSPAAQTLQSLCRWAAAELDNPQSAVVTSAAVAANVERTLLGLFIECLTECRYRGEEPSSDLKAAQVRLAEEWIEANLADPIGVDDIAMAIGVSPRALQTAFRRVRGYSPGNAVFRRRLARARSALAAATPDDTVTKIATDLGFFELGRFATRYREAFGERPSDTLARSLRRNRS